MWGSWGLAGMMVPALPPLLRMQQGFGGSFPRALESMSQQRGAGPGSRPPHLCVQWRCGPGQVWQGRQGLGMPGVLCGLDACMLGTQPAKTEEGAGLPSYEEKVSEGFGVTEEVEESEVLRCQAFTGGSPALLQRRPSTAPRPSWGGFAAAASL